MLFDLLLTSYLLYPALGQLGNIGDAITCETGREPMDFNCYGCYCGIGGAGKPIDGIDKCCQVHDLCYGLAQSLTCDPYFAQYGFSCSNGTAACIGPIPHSRKTKEDHAKFCSGIACLCDVELAKCLGENIADYQNPKPRAPIDGYCPKIERDALFDCWGSRRK